jgi:cytochrome b
MAGLNLQQIRVWDLPVRLGHWTMAGGFALAWITGDSEEWRLVHVYAGSAVLAVALFRLLWGFIGSRHARFINFVRGPAAAISYLKNLTNLSPPHYTGHNPAGGLTILALLTLAIASSVTGWFIYQEMFGSWPVKLHDMLATAMLGLVVIHLAGVAAGSIVHKENLVRAMITGRKTGALTEAISRPGYIAALVLISWTVAASWWLAQ